MGAAIGDTLSGAADSLGFASPDVHTFRAFLDSWHDFFLLTGTAAATLAGLLFIALSLHMEVLVQEHYRSMLVVARTTLTSFVTVLIVSLIFLVPHLAMRPIGVMLITFVGVFGVLTLREMRGALKHVHPDFPRRTVIRRVLLPLVGYGLIAVAGVGLLKRDYELTYSIISGMIMLLANAAWASWDLLVRVSRVKQRAKLEG